MTMDPIRYEVIRNRLISITEEMRIALQSVSGSPTVTEATDFFTGLFLPNGEFATMGFQVTHDAPPVAAMIQHLKASTKLTIEPGDMFIGNDPYVGALHQNDIQMVHPLFHEGEIVGWGGVMAHETDVGGMNFASWCPGAHEVFQEGMRIPCVKLVSRGEIREDVLEFIVTHSRLPAALELDIRAFIATLNVARERFAELVARYGAEEVARVEARMIDVSETHMRQRLSELPDGVFHASDFIEHDGHENRLYKIDLVLTKKGSDVTLDFSGSSTQAPGFINATRPGLHGGVAGALIPTLAFDIPWNQGLMRPIDIVAPDGLIVTAQSPAPVGAATVEGMWVSGNVTSAALNKMLACSATYRSRARGVSCGTMATFNMGGVTAAGGRFGFHMIDPLSGGMGATGSGDGIDAGGPPWVPMPAIADVERNERNAPIHYLYRRLCEDSGGPGLHRGGRAGEMALRLRPVRSAEAIILAHGVETPNSVGMFGGMPGSVVRQAMRYGVESGDALAAGAGAAATQLGPKPGHIPISESDIYFASWQGGGGWGDPIDRDPALVASDVAGGAVSASAARTIYGVEIDATGAVDAKKTDACRAALRSARIGVEVKTPIKRTAPPKDALQIAPGLFAKKGANGAWSVTNSVGRVMSKNSTAWRASAVRRALAPDQAAANGRLHKDLRATAFYCPDTGSLLAIDIHRESDEPSDDILLT